MPELRRTPLYDVHAARGARFVPFAGYEMPVQYTGVVAEHQAVRQRVGLFDVSHMGELIVEGPGAFDGLQYAITNDLDKLSDGKALYTVMCLESGGIIDDLIVYREAATRYFLVVNASRRDVDRQHLERVLERFDCRLTDESDAYALLALQGPRAFDVLAKVTDVDAAGMKPFTFVDATVGGVDEVRIARTGYTGEEGVELVVRAADAPRLWLSLEEAGGEYELTPCGLGARDTLRLEVKFPLYGNDLDEEHNPLEAGLGWVVKLAKGDFVGRARLEQVKAAGPERKLVGFKMRGRGIPRQGYPIRVEGREAGVVTSGTHSPSLGEPIGIGYVPASQAAVGAALEVVIRGKPVAAEVVKTPFYQRKSGS